MKKFKKNDFKNMKNKRTNRDFYSILSLYSSKKEEELKVGLIITKKSGNAVYRNRIRRIVQEFFRKNSKKITKKEYLLIFKKNKILNIKDTEKELYSILEKIKNTNSLK